LEKNVEVMVAYDKEDPSIADTIFFDRVGNMIEERKYWFHEWKAYDSLHFITRRLTRSEQAANFFITYTRANNSLIQKWNRLNHFKWNFNAEDLDPEVKFYVKFELDKNGWITKETNEYEGSYTSYAYDANCNLVNKEIRSLADGSELEKWTYYFDENNLTKVDHFVRDVLCLCNISVQGGD
jgi:hypothetical protein